MAATPDDMVSLLELKEVLKTTLQTRGVVDQIKARLRAEIANALEDKATPKPQLSDANLILNELIREYLEFNGYKHTLNVFMPETGQPVERPFSRGFIESELRLSGDSRVPLLYAILGARTGRPAASSSAPVSVGASAGGAGAGAGAGAGRATTEAESGAGTDTASGAGTRSDRESSFSAGTFTRVTSGDRADVTPGSILITKGT